MSSSLFSEVNRTIPALFGDYPHNATGAGAPGHYSITSAEGDVVYLTLTESPVQSSSEIEELQEMDRVLKALQTSEHAAPKDVKDIIAERRQIQKQLGILRKNLNQGTGVEARSKLNDLKNGKQW